MIYIDIVVGLNIVVDLLLLLGANRISGHPLGIRRCLLAALLGGFYAGIVLIPGWYALGGAFFRIFVWLIMSVIAYGWSASALRRGILFILCSMALCGIAIAMAQETIWALPLALICIGCLLVFGFGGRAAQKFRTMTLCYRGRQIRLKALCDTGNLLFDPVSGEAVSIIGLDSAIRLTGLDKDILSDPLKALAFLPGSRLIPCRGISTHGLLLAARMDAVLLDGNKSSNLVAFSPMQIGNGDFQALTGGIL